MKPSVGETVAVFLNGTTDPEQLRSGTITRVHDDGQTIDVVLNSRQDSPSATLLGCTFVEAAKRWPWEKRPAHSWDFIV